MSMRFIRNYGPIIITDIFIFILMLNFFTGELETIAVEAKAWSIAIGVIAMYYSSIYLNLSFIKEVKRRTPGYWGPKTVGLHDRHGSAHGNS